MIQVSRSLLELKSVPIMEWTITELGHLAKIKFAIEGVHLTVGPLLQEALLHHLSKAVFTTSDDILSVFKNRYNTLDYLL